MKHRRSEAYKRAVQRAQRSRKFRSWRRGVVLAQAVHYREKGGTDSGFQEQHFSPTQLAEKWALTPETIRKLFENESGIIILGNTASNRKRRYRTFRIPESVAMRVHRKITTS